MDGTDGHRWDDQLMTLPTEVLDDEEDDYAGAQTCAAQDDEPAELLLEDVVAAGRAACCWLDVVVMVRNVARHLGPAAGAWTP